MIIFCNLAFDAVEVDYDYNFPPEYNRKESNSMSKNASKSDKCNKGRNNRPIENPYYGLEPTFGSYNNASLGSSETNKNLEQITIIQNVYYE